MLDGHSKGREFSCIYFFLEDHYLIVYRNEESKYCLYLPMYTDSLNYDAEFDFYAEYRDASMPLQRFLNIRFKTYFKGVLVTVHLLAIRLQRGCLC